MSNCLLGGPFRRSRPPVRADKLVDRAINIMSWKLRRQASILENVTQGTRRHDPADPTLPLDPDEEAAWRALARAVSSSRSEEHTSELQSHSDLVCRLLLEKKK